jgi:pilus assembly protein CpaF
MENMVNMAGLNLPPKTIRQQIASAITVVIQVARMTDGRRKVVSIQEITGMEGDIIIMQEIFTFQRTGFAERLRVYGVGLPDETFDPARHFEA